MVISVLLWGESLTWGPTRVHAAGGDELLPLPGLARAQLLGDT